MAIKSQKYNNMVFALSILFSTFWIMTAKVNTMAGHLWIALYFLSVLFLFYMVVKEKYKKKMSSTIVLETFSTLVISGLYFQLSSIEINRYMVPNVFLFIVLNAINISAFMGTVKKESNQ
ncbi:hypothetical protein [Marinilactibacillus kalidii]|uniref:hypothetical protein n=1 Tax=Marinilactibacillus kalidii TaxID=2820274 RepID=UPI001ABD9F59|nr:hypothetical protein [Marinilactibacillus kalidii]